MEHDHVMATFVAEIILLLVAGRLLGEFMSRLRQPAIFGQLLAGVVLGPSVFGAWLPAEYKLIFPDASAARTMVDGLAQIGIMLLLLLTGMESNLEILNRRGRQVIAATAAGLAVPFAGGVMLGYALPDALVLSPHMRLATGLFLGTALAISSVKIVATVLLEIGAIRRDIGQLILTCAILDDTVAWVMIALVAGIATRGTIGWTDLGIRLGGVAALLALCYSIGPRLTAYIIRWSNDNLIVEAPVITATIVIMLCLALATQLAGVHTALGAFLAGVLVGQSPILAGRIEDELKVYIVAFFSPLFFAVAGLSMDLHVLAQPAVLLFAIAIAAIATVGKFSGAFLGGVVGGLSSREAIALGTGLNARGSTEVIVASIGLSLGVLTRELYTMIVAVAILTTLPMPMTLRWALARVPAGEDETKRLEREAAEAREMVPQIDRSLVICDGSVNGELALKCAALFAHAKRVATTAAPLVAGDEGTEAMQLRLSKWAAAAGGDSQDAGAAGETEKNVQLFNARQPIKDEDLPGEAAKGYGIMFFGRGEPLVLSRQGLGLPHTDLLSAFDGPLALALNATASLAAATDPLRILVPSGGATEARLATEIAVALAQGSGGSVTVLHVFDADEASVALRRRTRRLGNSILADAKRFGKTYGVEVQGKAVFSATLARALHRAIAEGSYDLVVLGASLRFGERKSLGPRSLSLIEGIQKPILLIAK